MLTRMAVQFDGVKERSADYAVAIVYEHAHRDAEHEHARKPEPCRTSPHWTTTRDPDWLRRDLQPTFHSAVSQFVVEGS